MGIWGDLHVFSFSVDKVHAWLRQTDKSKRSGHLHKAVYSLYEHFFNQRNLGRIELTRFLELLNDGDMINHLCLSAVERLEEAPFCWLKPCNLHVVLYTIYVQSNHRTSFSLKHWRFPCSTDTLANLLSSLFCIVYIGT